MQPHSLVTPDSNQQRQPEPKPKLLDQVRHAVRARHYSKRTENAYVGPMASCRSFKALLTILMSVAIMWMTACRSQPKPQQASVEKPTITSAPAPPAELGAETFLPTAVTLCDAAFSSQTSGVANRPPPGTLAPGSLFVVQSGPSATNGEWSHKPIIHADMLSQIPFLEAETAGLVKCIVCIKQRETPVGLYTDGSPAYRLNWSIRLVSVPNGKVLAETSFAGSQPPRKIYRRTEDPAHSVYGKDQSRALLHWLAGSFQPGQVFWTDGKVKAFSIAADGTTMVTLIEAPTTSIDEKEISFGSEYRLELWELATGKKKATLEKTHRTVYSMALSPDGHTLAAGVDRETYGVFPLEDATVKFWDVSSRKPLRTLPGDKEPVIALAFSPNGEFLATATSQSHAIKIWNLATGKEVLILGDQLARNPDLAFAPNGQMLATSGSDNSILLWDLATGKLTGALRGHSDSVSHFAFSPDGKSLVSGSFDKTAKLWDLETGQVVRTFTGHTEAVVNVAISPDGNTLASVGAANTPQGGIVSPLIRLWELSTGKEIRTLRGHKGEVVQVAWLPDGKRVVSGGGDAAIRIWNLGEVK